MSDAYIIEIADETAGIVVRLGDERSFKFHASLPRYSSLDGQRFDNPRAAEKAALARFRDRRSAHGRAA